MHPANLSCDPLSSFAISGFTNDDSSSDQWPDGDIPKGCPIVSSNCFSRDISPKASRIATFGITIHQMKNDHVIRNAKKISRI